ncbi:MAG: response regulator transcription factor [Chloroflexota bacterium]
MQDKILIVEDEARIVRTLRLYLEKAGYEVAAVMDGNRALPLFEKEKPKLVLLDLNLPQIDGLDLCREMRRLRDVPIIMLTARTEEMDRLIGLELGADDYITKPFSPREVVARVRAVLRRSESSSSQTETLRAGEILIDLAGYRVWLADQMLSLTQTEFEILVALVEHKGRVLSRMQLLDATQGISFEGFERSIDQHIKNLRRKIKLAVGDIPVIDTVYGVGYRIDNVEL